MSAAAGLRKAFGRRARALRAAAAASACLAAVAAPSAQLPGSPTVVQAQTTACDRSVIRAPFTGDTVSGSVTIFGSAEIQTFNFYKVEWATQSNPEVWSAVSTIIESPVRNGVLDRWDTRQLPDDVYRLKLTVVDEVHQEACRFTAERVAVRNSATPTPNATAGAGSIGAGDVQASGTATGAGAGITLGQGQSRWGVETPLPTLAGPAATAEARATASIEPSAPGTGRVGTSISPTAADAGSSPLPPADPEGTEAAELEATTEAAAVAIADSERAATADRAGAPEGAVDAPTVVSRTGSGSEAGTGTEAGAGEGSDETNASAPADSGPADELAAALGLSGALRAFAIGFGLVLAFAAIAWRIGARRAART